MITSGRNRREPSHRDAVPDEIQQRKPTMRHLLMFATAVGILAATPYASAQTRSFYDARQLRRKLGHAGQIDQRL